MKLQLGSHVKIEQGGGHLIARHRPLEQPNPLYYVQLFDGTVCSTTDVASVTNHSIDNPSVPAGLRSYLLGEET